MSQVFVNNFAARVAQTFGIADTSLYLDSTAGLPALTGGSYLLLTVYRRTGVEESGHEVVKVTAITGNMLTVVRSVEGAAASQFLAGDYVEARATAGTFDTMARRNAANTFTAAQEWATSTPIASAATINLDAATGNRVRITGTSTISSVTLTRGPRTVIFDDVLTLTHHATNNNLPGAANIITAPGDRAIYESIGTTVYCVAYTRANGEAVKPATVVYSYDNRASLRSLSPAPNATAIIEGLGLFVWVAGSTEPDDDESAFATANGVWLLVAANWDLVDAWQSVDDAVRDEDDEDEALRFASSFASSFASKLLYGTATCAITSVSAVSSTSFTGTVAGAAVGDRVIATPPGQLGSDADSTARLAYHAWVSATNTVTVMLTNASAASATTNAAIRTAWPITVIKT